MSAENKEKRTRKITRYDYYYYDDDDDHHHHLVGLVL